MARWRLTEGHYLNIIDPDTGKPTEWEHKETDRNTGKANRKMYQVPALLDPNDPADQNYPGDIIVCTGEPTREFRKDIQFFGSPTPGMEPLDEEAEAITESLRHKWEHPIDSLPANGQPQWDALTKAMMDSFAKQMGQHIPNTAVPNAEMEALKAQVSALTALVEKLTSAPAAERRA